MCCSGFPVLKPRRTHRSLAIPSQDPRRGKCYLGRPTPSASTFHFQSYFLPRDSSAAPHSLKDWVGVLYNLAQAFPPLFWFLIILPILRVPLVLLKIHLLQRGVPGGTSGKKRACHWRNIRDIGLIPGVEKIPGGHGPQLFLPGESPPDRKCRQAMVHSV